MIEEIGTYLPGSYGGSQARVSAAPGGGLVVVKTPTEVGASLATEVCDTIAAQLVPSVVRYKGHTENPWTLTTEYVPTARTRWGKRDIKEALNTCASVHDALKDLNGHEHVYTRHEGAVHAGLTVLTGKLRKHVQEAVTTLAELPVNELTVQHCDTRVENWVLSTRGPVLLDFGVAALAPRGWDEAVLVANHPQLPERALQRLLRKGQVNAELMYLAAGLQTALAAHALTSPNPVHVTWASTYLPVLAQAMKVARKFTKVSAKTREPSKEVALRYEGSWASTLP